MSVSSDRLSLAVDPIALRVERRAWVSKYRAAPVEPKARDLSDMGFAVICIGVASASAFLVCLFL
jgi:hypothetical protein